MARGLIPAFFGCSFLILLWLVLGFLGGYIGYLTAGEGGATLGAVTGLIIGVAVFIVHMWKIADKD